MTAPRRSRKWSVRPFLLGLALAAALPATITSLAAATTERIVIDQRTGLAIYGFDPVAYFTNAAAAMGSEELELPYRGAVWRFRNAGNRTAFVQRPDIYMPQFGGYDPVVLARGTATPGHPYLWLVDGNRLFLFHTREARDHFAADPQRAMAAANASWPEVLRELPRN
jgi:hypothetical protein